MNGIRCGGCTWHIVRVRKSRLLLQPPFFLLTQRVDLFSSFMQITGSCSQTFREKPGLQDAVSPLLHNGNAFHFSPSKKKTKKKTLFPFFFIILFCVKLHE